MNQQTKPINIVIYSKNSCGYCRAAKSLFLQRGLEFTEHEISFDRVREAEMKSRSGRHTVPQIFIGDHHVGGATDLFELQESGKLDDLLQASEAQ